MGRHGKEEFDSSVLIAVCQILAAVLTVVQILLLQPDIRRELSLVDKLEGVPIVDGRIDERSLTDKIMATVLSLWAGESS